MRKKNTAKVVKIDPPTCSNTGECATTRRPATHMVLARFRLGGGNNLGPMCETCARKVARELRKSWKRQGT